MKPIDLLAEVGKLLYGDHWKQPLAQDLAINPETIRKWVTGRRTLPADSPVIIRCADLLDSHRTRVRKELQEIDVLVFQFERLAAEQAPAEPTS